LGNNFYFIEGDREGRVGKEGLQEAGERGKVEEKQKGIAV
jgi:hypothetical protein